MQQKQTFSIEGMSCQSCASRIEKVLGRQEGVEKVAVNFAAGSLLVEFDDNKLNRNLIVQTVKKAGFDARLPSTDLLGEFSRKSQKSLNMPLNLWLLCAATLPFLIGMIGMMFGTHRLMIPLGMQAVLATFVQWGLAWGFYRRALASIRAMAANMDVLVSLGTLSVWAFSMWSWWRYAQSAHVYFEAGVMILTFVSLGKFWEERTKHASLNSIGELLTLTPEMVLRQTAAGDLEEVPLSQVSTGDLLQVSHGLRVGADGEIVAGSAWFDESHLTGEPNALFKQTGDAVLAGSLVVNGHVTYRAQSLGAETLLGDMMSALAEAQAAKAPISRTADRVAAVFVPVVLLIALITGLVNAWYYGSFAIAISRAVAVLVVSCPCALGLATPAAMMAGMGRAARLGVLFKDAAVMERAGSVNTIVLDKTGTLTTGKPKVVDAWLFDHKEVPLGKFLELAGALATASSHPLSNAIEEFIRDKGVSIEPAQHVESIAGEGMQALLHGQSIRLGNVNFCGGVLPDSLLEQESWAASSIVALSVDGVLAGAFAVQDVLRDDAAAVIRQLKTCGNTVHMMSGDNIRAVAFIAKEAGIEHFQGALKPRDKAEAIDLLMKKHHVVAMIGDGVNDAPALATASVGFAVHGSTSIAKQVADVLLLRQGVGVLSDALAVARATLRLIRQNLFFAFAYNVAAIPLAAFGYLNPVIAGAAMTLSSVSVVSNALRLRKMRLH